MRPPSNQETVISGGAITQDNYDNLKIGSLSANGNMNRTNFLNDENSDDFKLPL
jgi:hypothetical protein